MSMVCAQGMGNNTDVWWAGSQGYLELDGDKPVVAADVLQSIRLRGDGAVSFSESCVGGIKANEENSAALMERSLMLVTALAPTSGDDNATLVAKTAHKNGTTLREEAVKGGFVTEEEFDTIVRPEDMIAPK